MRVFGIKITLHPLFGFIILASVFTGYFIELLILFGIVLIHELGHTTMASYFGWKVKGIELLPFGGVAVVEQQGVVPAREELFVAMAGPLQNGWLIGVSLLLNWQGLWPLAWGEYFITANLMIALFNLLPVLPLDGGRMLQATMSMVLPYYKSLQLSQWISLGLSFGLVGYACFAMGSKGIQLNLLMIGLFLCYSNWYDLRHVHYQYLRFLMYRREQIARLHQSGVTPVPIVASHKTPIHRLLRMLMRDSAHQFVLLNDYGRVLSVVPELRMLQSYFHSPCSSPKYRVK